MNTLVSKNILLIPAPRAGVLRIHPHVRRPRCVGLSRASAATDRRRYSDPDWWHPGFESTWRTSREETSIVRKSVPCWAGTWVRGGFANGLDARHRLAGRAYENPSASRKEFCRLRPAALMDRNSFGTVPGLPRNG